MTSSTAFRTLALLATTLILLKACGGDDPSSGSGSDGPPPADLVLLGGTVATVDDAFSIAEAVAVNGYQITAVGTDEDIAEYVGPETRVVELQGRFVMPGFIEGHGHYTSFGGSLMILDFRYAESFGEIVSMVEQETEEMATLAPGSS